MIDVESITNQIINADCMDILKQLPDKCIDAIICDLPYGTTACSWDVVIPFDKLWEQYERIIKDNGAIVLFGSEPFSSLLRCSNLKLYKYDWIWEKSTSCNFLQSNFQPRKIHENISVFSKGNASYTVNAEQKMNYYPLMNGLCRYKIGDKKLNKPRAWADRMSDTYEVKSLNDSGLKYPESIIKFQIDKGKIHPTQKPVALIEYLIKTYSNEGDLILDNCSGSGTTAVACHNLKRRFICIEKDKDYFDASVERLKNAQAQLKLF